MTVDVASTFYTGPGRTLVAEIPGRTEPDERIVLVAHVQEPGANDNASGSATLYGLARALQDALKAADLTPTDVDDLRQMLVTSGARAATERLVEDLKAQAHEVLEGLEVDASARAALTDLAARATDRSI